MKGHVFTNDIGTWFLACVRCGETTFAEPSYKRRLCRRVPFIVDEILEVRHGEDENVHKHDVIVRIGSTEVMITGSGIDHHPLPTKAGDEVRLSHRDCRNYGLPIPRSCARTRPGKGKLFKKRWEGDRRGKFSRTFGFEKVDQPKGVWWTPNRHSIGRCPGEPPEWQRQVWERGTPMAEKHAAWLKSQTLDRYALQHGIVVATACSSTHADGVVCEACGHLGKRIGSAELPDGRASVISFTGHLVEPKAPPSKKTAFVSRRARWDHQQRAAAYAQIVAAFVSFVQDEARVMMSGPGLMGAMLRLCLTSTIDRDLGEAALVKLRLDRESTDVVRQLAMPMEQPPWSDVTSMLGGFALLYGSSKTKRRSRKHRNSGRRRRAKAGTE